MSLVSMPLYQLPFRLSVIVLSLAFTGEALALGLGELRSTPGLGQRPQLEIDLLGITKEPPPASCFHLRTARGDDDLPSLKAVSFTVVQGTTPTLLIRSNQVLREPIVQLSIQVGCGYEIVRDYIILASPELPTQLPAGLEAAPLSRPLPAAQHPAAVDAWSVPSNPPHRAVKQPRRHVNPPSGVVQGRDGAPPKITGLSDRLTLSGGGDVGDPSLRLATEIQTTRVAGSEIGEAQREILRLEFRTLLALNEQATSQLAAAEKLRQLESSLSELQRRSSEITQKVAQDVTATAAPSSTVVATPAPSKPMVAEPEVLVVQDAGWFSETSLYALLLAMVLGIGAWLGWRNYRERRARVTDEDQGLAVPPDEIDPQRIDEREELGGVDLDVDPAVMGAPMQVAMQVDIPLDGDHSPAVSTPAKVPSAGNFDSMMSIAAATVDEHFEANPVMELADIMLSFGRVKGAAQALQEYIDHNPQEALQPWIRLMDVYRMAGLRAEFDSVARNLNQNFNVEIQQWDPDEPTHNRHTLDMVFDDDAGVEIKSPVTPTKASGIEDMPRIMQQVTDLWRHGDVVAYLQQLLRDNREGKRAGFPLEVVSDMLFLIDLKEGVNKAVAR